MTLSKRSLRRRIEARNALIVQQLEDAELTKRGEAWMSMPQPTSEVGMSTRSRAKGEPRSSRDGSPPAPKVFRSRVSTPAATRFGQRLRDLREVRELTQAALAAKAGLHWSAISQLESGRRTRPQRETVLRLAEALELDVPQTAELLIETAHSVQALLSEPVIVEALEYLRDAGDAPGARLLRQQVALTLRMVRGEAS